MEGSQAKPEETEAKAEPKARLCFIGLTEFRRFWDVGFRGSGARGGCLFESLGFNFRHRALGSVTLERGKQPQNTKRYKRNRGPRVWGLGVRVQGLGIKGLGFRVQGLG